MPLRLQGKVSIVTGAGSGIGRAISIRFVRAGSKVVVVDVDSTTGMQTVDMIRDAGGEAVFVRCDVTNSEQVNALDSRAIEEFGKVDVLVNNAGIFAFGPIENLSEKDWDRVMAVNLKGPFLCSQTIGRHMIEKRSGVILNTISISAQVPELHMGAYTPSKAGLLGLTQILALEWAKYGIRVVGISPGPIRTPMHDREYHEPRIREARHRAVPMGRPGEPEEIAKVAEFLVSDDASFITGETVVVDGGSILSMYHTIYLLKEYASKN